MSVEQKVGVCERVKVLIRLHHMAKNTRTSLFVYLKKHMTCLPSTVLDFHATLAYYYYHCTFLLHYI